MSNTSRRRASYHHGDLRRALIEASVELAIEHGPDGVSMREAARRAGVSTSAPYRHFSDRDTLMSAVAAAGYQRLLASMEADASQAGPSPLEQLRAFGMRYVTFAVEHPNLFRVMQTAKWCDPNASPEMAEAHHANARIVGATSDRAVAEGELAPQAHAMHHVAAHALVYGLARMYVDGHAQAWGLTELPLRDVVEGVTGILGRGLIPRPGCAPQDDDATTPHT